KPRGDRRMGGRIHPALGQRQIVVAQLCRQPVLLFLPAPYRAVVLHPRAERPVGAAAKQRAYRQRDDGGAKGDRDQGDRHSSRRSSLCSSSGLWWGEPASRLPEALVLRRIISRQAPPPSTINTRGAAQMKPPSPETGGESST